MTKNDRATVQNYRYYFNNSIRTTLLIIAVILLIGLQGASELVIIEPSAKNSVATDADENRYINYGPDPIQAGYIFPSDFEDLTGLSLDINDNGIEDFIEINKQTYVSNEYINTVITLTTPATDELINTLEALGCVVDHKFTIIDALGVSIPVEMLDNVGRLPTVKLIQSIHKVKSHLNDAVPLVEASQSKLSAAGYNGINGEGVSIAVIDSGIDKNHHTFANRIIAFKDFWYGNDDLDPTDGMDAQEYGYHGTMVTSCAAGSGTYKGVAINSNIISVAVDTTYDMIRGIEWCVDNQHKDFNKDGEADGPDIISMSMGVPGNFPYLDNTAGSAMDNGVVFVTSAGNEGPGAGTVTSPATSSKVIAVGATKKNKVISDFSSRGPGPGGIIKPDVVAPGEGLTVAYPGNQWYPGGYGTSFSCPIVAGVAALILQYDPELDPYEVKDIIRNSAEDRGTSGPDNTYGYGFVDAIAALDMVLKVKSIVPSSSSVNEDSPVSFTATASGTKIVKYEWDFDNNGEFDETTTTGSVSHIFIDEGVYEVQVRITNEKDKTAENSVVITVNNIKPRAEFKTNGDSTIFTEDEVILFNGSNSWDTPSDIDLLEFSWSFNGGINYTNYSKEDKTIEHLYEDTGEYNIIMKVKDDNDVEDITSRKINIENFKPIADAGEDITAFEGELIYFSASETNDTESDLETMKYLWDFADGITKNGINQTHSFQAYYNTQTFEVKLTVTDDDDERDSDTITVTILNSPPRVTVEPEKSGFEDEPISLSGFGNDTENDVDRLMYKWDFDDGENTNWLNNPIVTHTYTQVGLYHPKLFVKDPKDAISSNELNVTIYNVPPVADFNMDVKTAIEDELVTFDASASVDTESDIEHLIYIWDFGDGNIATGKTVQHQYFQSYKYTIKLTVKDDNDDTNSVTKRLTVENLKPTAKFKIESEGDELQVNQVIQYYGYLSTDTPSDKINLTYQWDFGDNKHSSGANATHEYTKRGDYVIRLRVLDDDGEADEMRMTVSIFEEPEDEDILAKPTIENRGLLIYAGVAIVVIILLLILLSFLMVYQGKKGIFKRMADKVQIRRRGTESLKTAWEDTSTYPPPPPPPPPYGTIPEHEQYYTDAYGGGMQQYGYFHPMEQMPIQGYPMHAQSNIPPGTMSMPQYAHAQVYDMPPPKSAADAMQMPPSSYETPILPPPAKHDEDQDE